MSADEDAAGSVTRWLSELKAGDAEAARPLWERYFSRLVRLARAKLQRQRRHGAVADEEDAALSAFDSFCAGAAQGRFPLLRDRDDLWRLLVVITARKAAAQAQWASAQKRGGGWHEVQAAESSHSADDLLGRLVAREPTPEFAAMVAEESGRLLDRLESDELRRIAIERMEGYSCDEIADRLGCARRTVARRLDLIRRMWGEGAEAA